MDKHLEREDQLVLLKSIEDQIRNAGQPKPLFPADEPDTKEDLRHAAFRLRELADWLEASS